ncbi:hypothetical protein ACFO3J_25345 [Streptomyces polygonati]|uniref:Uncharacterized protein n=1 Tax=Streptomyces polygonati TaxID=1617087 RepID=A0ABV8HV39_9ACTN
MNEGIIRIGPAGDPPGAQPPEDEIGAFVAGPPFICRGPSTAVIVPWIQVFSTGLLVMIDVRFRASATPESARLELRRIMHGDDEPMPGRLHVEIGYPDGTITRNLRGPERPSPGSRQRSALRLGAMQSGPRWELVYWVRGLPTGGAAELRLGWPDRQVDFAGFGIPAAAVGAAVRRVRNPWG